MPQRRTASWISTVCVSFPFLSSARYFLWSYWVSCWPCIYKPYPLLDCPSILYPLTQLYNPHINPSLLALCCPRNMLACFLLGCRICKSTAKAPCHTTAMQLSPTAALSCLEGELLQLEGRGKGLAERWLLAGKDLFVVVLCLKVFHLFDINKFINRSLGHFPLYKIPINRIF